MTNTLTVNCQMVVNEPGLFVQESNVECLFGGEVRESGTASSQTL